MADSKLPPQGQQDKSIASQSENKIILRPETSLAPIADSAPEKSYSIRLVKHAYQQTRRHAKLELVATSIAGFILGALAGGATWAGLGLAVGGFFAAIGLIFVCYLMLAPRELDAALWGELEGLNQKLVEAHARQLPAIAGVASQVEIESPNLVCVRARLVDVTKHKNQILTLGGKDGRAAIAILRNDAGNFVTDVRNVRAHIDYYGDDGIRRYQVSTGLWIGRDDETVDFSVGHPERLIICVFFEDEDRFIIPDHNYERDSEGRWIFLPVTDTLTDEKYQVEVALVGGKSGKRLGVFKFNLMLRPVFGINLIDS
jgi:hypothetical protein